MEKEILNELINKGFSTNGLAKELNCSQTNIRYWLRKYKLKTKRAENLWEGDNKICIDCKISKPSSEYYRNKGHFKGIHSHCKTCTNKKMTLRWVHRKIQYINLMGGACEKCGLKLEDSHYAVYEFHHKFGEKKDYNWTKLRLRSDKSVVEELAKCSLLCANCHRLIHAEFRDLQKAKISN